MGETASGTPEATLGAVRAAARCLDGLIDRNNDVGNARFGRGLRQAVSPARPPSRQDQSAAAQFPEQLLQIGQGNLLTRSDFREPYRLAPNPVARMTGEIGHRLSFTACLLALGQGWHHQTLAT